MIYLYYNPIVKMVYFLLNLYGIRYALFKIVNFALHLFSKAESYPRANCLMICWFNWNSSIIGAAQQKASVAIFPDSIV